MNEALLWLLMTAAWTAFFVWFALWRLPRFGTRLAIRRFSRAIGGEPWNRLRYVGLPTATNNPTVATSPDMLLVFGIYDLSSGPVCIKCKVPPTNTYWSISLYALNTDNFFVLNDQSASRQQFDLVIVPQGRSHQKKVNEELAVSPTTKGAFIVRAIVQDRENAEEIERLQQELNQVAIVPYA
jgi:uncharacterized membrane protein